jgi:hypothetical protein
MSREQLKDILEAIGVIAIVVSLVFLTFEIRTNTATNQIAIFQSYSSNWFEMHSQLAGNRELATLVEKARSGEVLEPVEALQYRSYVFQRVTQSNHMLRFYDEELIPESEVRRAFRAIREEAKTPSFRQEIETIGNTRLRSLILEEDGLDSYLNASEMGRLGAN